MPNLAMPATLSHFLSGLTLSAKPCPGASGKHKDSDPARPWLAQARHWPGDARPAPCQGMPGHAVSALWTRQSVVHPVASVLPLQPYHCITHPLDTL